MSFRRGFTPEKSFITIGFLLLCGTFFSCITMPPVPNGFERPGANAAAEAGTAADGDGAVDDTAGITDGGGDTGGELPSGGEPAAASPADEIPEVNLPLPEEKPDEAAGEPGEPLLDLPETTEALLHPEEEDAGAGFREPEAPVLDEVPEAVQNEKTEELPAPSGLTPPPSEAVPPPQEPPPPAPPPPQEPPPPAPPPPQKPPPPDPPPQEPPPPEPARDPPAPPPFLRPPEEAVPPREREPVPAPENPVPDLPARTPPPAVPGDELVFSRTVRAAAGQIVEIPFKGAGWVYLGELSSRRGLAYDSRRLDPEGQSFVFRCETPGTYVLKFYRQDFIRDYILNDHVQVVVEEAPESAGIGLFNPPVDKERAIAEPRWPPPGREQEDSSREPRAETPAGNEKTAPETPPPETAASESAGGTGGVSGNNGTERAAPADILEDSRPDSYVRRALEEYNAGRVAQALAVMDGFRQRFPAGTDEAWWLLGQLLEANSPARDIRLSLEYYRRLVREFPQSPRVPAARRRIAYLERFYLNIQ